MTGRGRTLGAAGMGVLMLMACRAEEGRADMSETGDAIEYDLSVTAPDACHVLDAGEARVEEGGNLIVRRTLRREDGLCAQVLTEVPVRGRVPDAGAYGKVTLQVVDPRGEILQSFPLG